MREWKQHLIIGTIFSVTGIVLILWAASISIPSPYNTFVGIPYSINPQFETTSKLMLVLFIGGFFALGLGLGLGVSASPIHKLENRFTSSYLATPLLKPLPSPIEKKYCAYCGTENTRDDVFCNNCGKQMES
jgi:hypothetical protein